MKKNVIFGAGKLGQQLYRHLSDTKSCLVHGYFDDLLETNDSVIGDQKVLGNRKDLLEKVDEYKVFFAIGYSNLEQRLSCFQDLKEHGVEFTSFISPMAMISPSAKIEEGNIILAGSIIDIGVHIEAGNFIDIGVRIGEDGKIAQANYFSSSSIIGGGCEIGQGNFIGMSSTIVNDIKVGNLNFINAASFVYTNLDNNRKVVEVRTQRIL